MESKKRVALALSSGGPRGFTYIGAIEVLRERGYEISSVAGTSIGSLIGGIYAAGALDEFKEWLFTLDKWRVFSLMDLSLGGNHFVKGDRIIEAMREVVPSVNIEELSIPFRAIATDLYTGEEVVFDHGDLFAAIRASISIPSLFRPVPHGLSTLVDGFIVNCLPLSRTVRTDGDLLVAFDLNDINAEEIRSLLDRANKEQAIKQMCEDATLSEARELVEWSHSNRRQLGMLDRLKHIGSRALTLFKDYVEVHNTPIEQVEEYDSYYSLIDRAFSLMNHSQTELSLQLYKPDIVVRMPFDAYGEIADYAKAQEIAEAGRTLMSEALDRYEATLQPPHQSQLSHP